MLRSPALLGPIESQVCPREKMPGVIAAVERHRNTDTGANREMESFVLDGKDHSVDQPPSQRDRLADIANAFGHDQEFVAANPCDTSPPRTIGPHSGADVLEDLVANLMTVVVVGPLEVVQIDVQERRLRRRCDELGPVTVPTR